MDNYNYGRRPPNVEGMVSLKVDNLSFRVTPDEIKPIFEKFGEVGDVYIPRDRYSKDSRGFAFVRFYDRRDAEEAMARMDGHVMDGREMRVQLARFGRPNENQRKRGGYGGGYGGRSNYGRYNRQRSRSRSYSRSRSRSPRRNKRSPSHSRSRSPKPSRHPRSHSRSRSHSRERSNSPVKEERAGSRSPSPRNREQKDGSPLRISRSPSPARNQDEPRSRSGSPVYEEKYE